MSFRWLARICSLIGMFFLVGFFNTESIMSLDFKGWILFIVFPCVLLSGYILSWMYDITGAVVSLAAIILFYLLHYFFNGSLPLGSAFLLFGIPPSLFILARWKDKLSKGKSTN
jgi:hypothetical protein